MFVIPCLGIFTVFWLPEMHLEIHLQFGILGLTQLLVLAIRRRLPRLVSVLVLLGWIIIAGLSIYLDGMKPVSLEVESNQRLSLCSIKLASQVLLVVYIFTQGLTAR